MREIMPPYGTEKVHPKRVVLMMRKLTLQIIQSVLTGQLTGKGDERRKQRVQKHRVRKRSHVPKRRKVKLLQMTWRMVLKSL